MVMKTFLHVAISGMVAFSSHVAILVCHQAELCDVYVFYVSEFSVQIRRNFHSHLPNMIDCTVAGMTTTLHSESISGQNANAIMPTPET